MTAGTDEFVLSELFNILKLIHDYPCEKEQKNRESFSRANPCDICQRIENLGYVMSKK